MINNPGANVLISQKIYANEKLHMQKVMNSSDFTNEELKECVAEMAARAAVSKLFLDYVLSENKTLIANGQEQLKKTGLYSGQLSSEEIDRIYLAFDAGIVTQKSDAGRNAQRKSYASFAEAKEFVLNDWLKFGESEYKNNKSKFAADYSRRIRNEFIDNKRDPMDVAVQTIINWLPKTNQKGRPKKIK